MSDELIFPIRGKVVTQKELDEMFGHQKDDNRYKLSYYLKRNIEEMCLGDHVYAEDQFLLRHETTKNFVIKDIELDTRTITLETEDIYIYISIGRNLV